MKLVFLGGEGMLTNAVYQALAKNYKFEKVIIEDPVPLRTFLARRRKRLGVRKVVGQIAFKAFIVPVLKFTSKKRISEIENQYHLNFSDDYKTKGIYYKTQNVNSEECISLLKSISPDVIIVNGTRILGEELLNSTSAKVINMHMGITPTYRGVHGAYWAYYNQDSEHAGVTVHLVDSGIDTGGILYQRKIEIMEKDNYYTYPYIQVGQGIELELQAIKDIERGCMKLVENALPSGLYSHPGMIQYLYGRIKRKAK